MSFNRFAQAIAEPALRRVARHWNAVRPAGGLPGWSDLRPSAIAAELQIIWSWRYDAAQDSFTGRLAGDAIERIFGRTFRNTPMSEMFSPAEYMGIFARHKRVIQGPCLFHGAGPVFRHLQRIGVGERIILPLSDGGGAADGLLGATVYEAVGAELPVRASGQSEREEWFDLD